MINQQPLTFQAVNLIKTIPHIPLPERLQKAPPRIAMEIIERFEEAAEFDALPGFIGDPRGKAVVASWKTQIQERMEPRSSVA